MLSTTFAVRCEDMETVRIILSDVTGDNERVVDLERIMEIIRRCIRHSTGVVLDDTKSVWISRLDSIPLGVSTSEEIAREMDLPQVVHVVEVNDVFVLVSTPALISPLFERVIADIERLDGFGVTVDIDRFRVVVQVDQFQQSN